jgi:hypothetical protein
VFTCFLNIVTSFETHNRNEKSSAEYLVFRSKKWGLMAKASCHCKHWTYAPKNPSIYHHLLPFLAWKKLGQ